MAVTALDPALQQLLVRARSAGRVPVAVVHSVEAPSLQGALEAQQEGLVEPTLVGDDSRVHAVAETLHENLDNTRFVPVTDDREAAGVAVGLVRGGQAAFLLKGHSHT